jgi:nucleoid-associated protein EbfC
MAGLGDLLGLFSNLGSLQKKVRDVQDELAKQSVEGASADGKVVVTVTGRMEVVGVKIDPAVAGSGNSPALEEAVRAAVAQAIDRARQLQRDGMKKVLGDMPLPPGLMDMVG